MSNIKIRIKQKIDTTENWEKATNFIPLRGEYCFYSDTNKIKVGNGSDYIADLPYVTADNATYAEFLGSYGPDNFVKMGGKIQLENGLPTVEGVEGINYTYGAADGIMFYPTDSKSNAAWIRASSNAEDGTAELEIASSADGLDDFNIHFKGYDNTNTSVIDIQLPKKSGTIALLEDIEKGGMQVYTVTTDEVTSVQDFKTLYESHQAAGKNYLYNLTAFDKLGTEDLRYCLINFESTSSNSFFRVKDIANGKEYNDNLGYLYNSAYPLKDYFNGMNVGYTFRVLKITRTDLTFAFIKMALDYINELGINLFFDLSALLPKAYLCSIELDSDTKKATVHNLINNYYATIDYDDTTLLTDIFPYVEQPIKVYNELPAAGNYIGDMCLVKGYGWKDLSSDNDLVSGKTYQLKIPAGTSCYQYSSIGNYVEVLNMTVKTSGKEAQTYSYTEEYDSIVHTGSFTTNDKFYICTSINKEARTFVGYDFTESTGDTEFLATGTFNTKNVTVSGYFLAFMSLQQENYSSPKIWNGITWSDLASKANLADVEDVLLRVVDLSYYNVGDEIAENLVETLKNYKSNIKYSSAELRFIRESDETAYGYSDVLTYEGIEFLRKDNGSYHAYIRAIAVGQSTKDNKWYLVGYYTPKIAAYSPDSNKLSIQVDDSNQFNIVDVDNNKTVNITLDTTMADSAIDIKLPTTSGTFALVSDTEVTKDKVTNALGYTPYNGATNENGYITKTVSDLTNYYTSSKVDELIAAGGSGESTNVVANPTTTSSDLDLSSIQIKDTKYNINAKKLDGHDVDDLTAIINAAYTPEVTVDSMNAAIENKIQEALADLQFNKYYTGTAEPASTFGEDGDLYLQQ